MENGLETVGKELKPKEPSSTWKRKSRKGEVQEVGKRAEALSTIKTIDTEMKSLYVKEELLEETINDTKVDLVRVMSVKGFYENVEKGLKKLGEAQGETPVAPTPKAAAAAAAPATPMEVDAEKEDARQAAKRQLLEEMKRKAAGEKDTAQDEMKRKAAELGAQLAERLKRTKAVAGKTSEPMVKAMPKLFRRTKQGPKLLRKLRQTS